MRHLTNFVTTLILFSFALLSANAVIQGGVDYQIPIDYTKLNQSELEAKAEFYYNTAVKSKKLNEDMTSALVLYTILSNKNPSDPTYTIRLGKLYDVMGKDRFARGNYSQAHGLNQKNPAPYFYLGEYYYDREQYRKALKHYKKAYELGYSTHYSTLYKIGDIYQKLGDTQNALKYLQSASKIEPNEKLNEKIKQVENADTLNKEFYRR